MDLSQAPNSLAPGEFKKWRAHWCAWPTSRLGTTLYAFNQRTDMAPEYVQRAACFCLTEKQIQWLQKTADEWSYLRLHLTARKAPTSADKLTELPVFALVIEPVLRSSYGSKQPTYLKLAWEPVAPPEERFSGRFSTAAIAPETAVLFCQQFCQYPERDLGSIFEGYVGSAAYRVNFYEFSNAPKSAQNIEKQIKELINSIRGEKDGTLNGSVRVFLGLAKTFPGSPYGFKPILKISRAKRQEDLISVAINDEEEERNFDHTQQCPPLC